jgi:hypothetical protein
MLGRRGFSLISVLIASAVTGILALIIMTVIDHTTRVMVRGNAQDALDGMVRTVTAVLNNRDLCNRALRGAGVNTLIDYTLLTANAVPPANEVNIARIYINHPPPSTVPPNIILQLNQQIFSGIRVGAIIFREIQPGVGRGEYRASTGNQRTYAGEVVIRLGDPNRQLLGGTLERRIPVTVRAWDVNGDGFDEIDGCLVHSDQVEVMCRSMGGTFEPASKTCTGMNPAGNTNCQTECNNNAGGGGTGPCPGGLTTCKDPDPNPGVANWIYCYRIYVAKGINVPVGGGSAVPACQCQMICYRGTDGGGAAAAAAVNPGAGGPAAATAN